MSNTRTWSGTVAFFDRLTSDGRMLSMSELWTRDLPLPLVMVGAIAWTDEIVGTVDTVGREGDAITASGTIDLDEAQLTNARLTARLLDGEQVGVGITLFGITTREGIVKGSYGETTGRDFVDGQLSSVHIHDNQAWPDAVISLVES